MLKTRIKVLLLLFAAFLMMATAVVVGNDPTSTSFNFEFETQIGNASPVVTDLGSKDYGSSVTIDAGTFNPSYEFATYIVNGKVEPNLPESHDFLVTKELDVTALYKPSGEIMVAFMDANQDVLKLEFITSGGDATPPDTSGLSVPGYVVSTTPWSGSYIGITEDTVLWVMYDLDDATAYTVSVTNGSADQPSYSFNEVATVTASGPSNFQYWEKDGEIVSLKETYSFTVLANTTLTAVYDTPSSPNPDGLFVSLIPYTDIETGNTTYVGQFNIPDGQDLIEYGVISSENFLDMITLDTPDIEKIHSNKYNPDTYEYVRHLDDSTYGSRGIRGYIITTNGSTETITYSDYTVTTSESCTSELFISEYIEGSSYNKAIEIYNGTCQDVDLTDYSIVLYSNGNTTPEDTEVLSGTLSHGEVFILSHGSADSDILAVADATDGGTANWNGDDAIVLEKSGVPIDIIGVVGVDPGSSWPAGTGDTKDNTIVRNSDVTGPNPVWDDTEWTSYSNNTFTYLDSHTTDSAVSPTSVTISGDTTMDQGNTTTLSAIVAPGGAPSEVYWMSSDTSLATITQGGLVSAWGAGQVTIYAYSTTDSSVYDTHTIDITAVTTHTVVFDSTPGSLVPSQEVVDGQTAFEPTDPTLTGKIFLGWWDGITPGFYDFSTPVTGPLNLFAMWDDYYTVTYESNGGTAVASEQLSANFSPSPATEPSDPTQTDKTFAGWYTDDGTFLNAYNFATIVTSDLTLYAKWDDVPDPLTWDLDTYYDDAEGLEGAALEAALTTIINTGFSGVSYGDSRYILDDTDVDPNNSSKVILVYLQTSVSGVWDSGATWNREHVWPQSLLGSHVNNSSISVGSDLHNLKPANPSENSSRSNKYFANATDSQTYEPPAHVKGDIARILFYMQVMYNDGTLDLELVDGAPSVYQMGDLATLLEWHENDPVDAFEEYRNDVIFGQQGNYNPFIDYPHFVELIWGDHSYYTGE